jgi:RNA polymerase sigma factor (sigma-70 family)
LQLYSSKQCNNPHRPNVYLYVESNDTERLSGTYRRERSRLLAFIRSRVGSGDDAEDILHEVFVQAVRSPNVLASVDNLVAWLFRIARNRVVDWYRRRGRRQETSLDADAGEGTGSLGELIADTSIDLDRDLVRRMTVDALATAVASLPAAQREAFVGNVIEGRTFREMAEQTNTPLGTLLARKSRAVAKLRETLEDLEEVIDELDS